VRVETLSKIEPAALRALHAGHGALPYGHYPEIGAERLEAYAGESLARALDAHGALAFGLDGGAAGVALYRPLSWDSEMLGCAVGTLGVLRVDEATRPVPTRFAAAAQALVGAAFEAGRESGSEYLTVRVDARELAFVHALEARGFRVVDGLQRFAFDLAQEIPAPEIGAEIAATREAREDDVPDLRALAEHGFVFDRFHQDPAIASERADRLYAEWVENAVRGRTGSGVVVAERNGVPAGFCTLGEDALAAQVLGLGVGTLVIVSVDARARRRGLGRLLTFASLAWLRARGNRFAEVGTQLANLPAARVYARAGFRPVESSLTLRWWLGDTRR
jgi:ribosomal protein S18 acetylase RimI-like enzyme